MSSYEEERNRERLCPTVTEQMVSVSMPIAIVPYANVERVRLRCNGTPTIINNETQCRGKKDGICYFTISQSFSVEIPVNFGANVSSGDTFVECLGNINVANEECGCN